MKIGPYLEVPDDYIPRMQDALETDFESGSHALSNSTAEEINKLAPTILAMASLIEQQRDSLLLSLEVARQCLAEEREHCKRMIGRAN